MLIRLFQINLRSFLWQIEYEVWRIFAQNTGGKESKFQKKFRKEVALKFTAHYKVTRMPGIIHFISLFLPFLISFQILNVQLIFSDYILDIISGILPLILNEILNFMLSRKVRVIRLHYHSKVILECASHDK